MIRAYLPLTGLALAAQWPSPAPALAFAPGSAQRALRGEEAEVWEHRAMAAAAASIAEEALDAGCPRAVIACDIPLGADRGAQEVIPGIVAIPGVSADPSRVASVHIDDPEGFGELPPEREAALAALAGSDLLWFDSAEVGDLVELFGQMLPDEGLEG
ncbi:DUF6912 family protein [Brevibacterium album]|uniref:DUF6912 family protein n=1 Tax=Brevibacterium album TaxID=417948 RepID=UPI00041CE5BA|nr:hypothetical protein [Brevibacterium album]